MQSKDYDPSRVMNIKEVPKTDHWRDGLNGIGVFAKEVNGVVFYNITPATSY